MATMRQIDKQSIDGDGILSGIDHTDQASDAIKAVFDGEGGQLSSIGGTATVITGVASVPDGLAYVDGMQFRFFTTSAAAGATTINISSLGAIPVKRRDGTVIKAGDWKSGQLVKFTLKTSIAYLDGPTNNEAASEQDTASEVGTIIQSWGVDVHTQTNNAVAVGLSDVTGQSGDLLIFPKLIWVNASFSTQATRSLMDETRIGFPNTGTYGAGARVEFRVDQTKIHDVLSRGGAPSLIDGAGSFNTDPLTYQLSDSNPHDYDLYIDDDIGLSLTVQCRGLIKLVRPTSTTVIS